MFGIRIVYEPRGGFWGVCRAYFPGVQRRPDGYYLGDVIR